MLTALKSTVFFKANTRPFKWSETRREPPIELKLIGLQFGEFKIKWAGFMCADQPTS